MSIVIENESALPVTLTENDFLAVGVEEEDIPSIESCAILYGKRERFLSLIDWTGAGKDQVREVVSPKKDTKLLVVIHKVPRFAACDVKELPEKWQGYESVTGTTTLGYETGDVDYLIDDAEGGEFKHWNKTRPWSGQTICFEDECLAAGN